MTTLNALVSHLGAAVDEDLMEQFCRFLHDAGYPLARSNCKTGSAWRIDADTDRKSQPFIDATASTSPFALAGEFTTVG